MYSWNLIGVFVELAVKLVAALLILNPSRVILLTNEILPRENTDVCLAYLGNASLFHDLMSLGQLSVVCPSPI